MFNAEVKRKVGCDLEYMVLTIK